VNGNNKGHYITNDDKAKNTLRQKTQCNTYTGPLTGPIQTYENDYYAKDVKREYNNNNSYYGTAVGPVEASRKDDYIVENTKRNVSVSKEMQKNNIIQGLKQVPLDQNISSMYIQTDKREAVSTSYTPGMGRVNLMPDAIHSTGQMNVKPDNNKLNYQQYNAPNVITTANDMGNVLSKKEGHYNNRLGDIGVIQKQLASNPYNRSITK
jgi:hypothetical protein